MVEPVIAPISSSAAAPQPLPDAHQRNSRAVYALSIFLSAFLLFEVQPLIAKEILPWFGGSAGVWTACMPFFQLLLVGGYAYAHWLSRGRSPGRSPGRLPAAGRAGIVACSTRAVSRG
jgi:hypothetical protein